MSGLDWAITGAMFLAIAALSVTGRLFMKDVAGYLAAGRSAGRYLLTVSTTASMVGAISIVAFFQQNLEAGFVLQWWEPLASVAMVVAMLTGWVIYRFRQTRCLTLAEFFERRYSRRFRVFAGLVAFGSGMLNFGIFPSVGSRFFLYFCGLPETVIVGGVEISLYVSIMVALLTVSVTIVLLGGQVCVVLTDFLQGAVTNVAFVALTAYLLWLVPWSQVGEVLLATEPGVSKINPFDTGEVENFNVKFFMIGLIGYLYTRMSWQGTQAYNASAKSAHEAKMGAVLYIWNDIGKMLFTATVPVLAFVLLSHSDWGHVRAGVEQAGAAIDSESVRSQMLVPLTLREVLPIGLRGLMAAMMLGAFVSTHTTYLHSWSAIFIQDVVLPLRPRGKPLSQRAQLTLLRGAAVGVAAFALVFSTLVVPSEALQLYFAATGAIFVGWSGAVIIGGLYWRRGTTTGAWVSAVAGVTLVLAGLFLQQAETAWNERGIAFFGVLDWVGQERAAGAAVWVQSYLPNGQELWGWSMLVCTVLYIGASAPWRTTFDLDRLLHRDEAGTPRPLHRARSVLRFIGISAEFTRADRRLYFATIVFNGFWILVLAGGSAYVAWHVHVRGLPVRDLDPTWSLFWKYRVLIMLSVASAVTLWFLVGGIRDVASMLRALRTREASASDTGIVNDSEAP